MGIIIRIAVPPSVVGLIHQTNTNPIKKPIPPPIPSFAMAASITYFRTVITAWAHTYRPKAGSTSLVFQRSSHCSTAPDSPLYRQTIDERLLAPARHEA